MAHGKLVPKLIPLSVPWQVAPSTPFVRLCVGEAMGAVVRFAAHFGLEHSVEDRQCLSDREVVGVVSADALDRVVSGDRRAPYKVVRVVFRTAPWARFLPSFSGSQTIDEKAYDWSGVPGQRLRGESIEEWLKRRSEQWLRTSICPDPWFYEVEGSLWLAETGAASYGMKHYLIVGDDGYAEVLGQDWSWEVEGVLEGW